VDGEATLRQTYRAFNNRDTEAVLELLHPEVDWPNAWEGGRVVGRDGVRDYWIRQFAEISSHVEPESFTEEPDGAITVEVTRSSTTPTAATCSTTPKSGIATGSTTMAW
jgi:ketosteroid isomerase-like protein